MKNKKVLFRTPLVFFLLLGLFVSQNSAENDKRGSKIQKPVYRLNKTQASGKQGDSYRMNINNVNLPLNRKGVIADVNIPPDGSGGQFAGNVFLFSSGFFLSGNADGLPWANAVASATLVEDYVEGTVADGQGDSRAQIYVINNQDEPFGDSWNDWADAVDLGADFYDGDGDGVYNPRDLNDNGKWDPDEDMPDLLGDETAWCVYNDGIRAAQRRWNTVDPLGIEVRQTVFAFASAGAIGNLIFVRYRFQYVGLGDPTEPDQLDDVYFGVWADPDLGDHQDDLVGVDVATNSGYLYNDGEDDQYGQAPPCFMIDFFSGPVAYIPGETFIDNNGNEIFDEGDEAIDTAYSVRGQQIGIAEFPGARNLGIASFVHYLNGDPDLNDPSNKEEARNYMLGLTRIGEEVDPCDWSYGEVRGGVDCATVDNRFWYSGDPVTDVGWINILQTDQRQMQNIGPFVLEKNVEKEVVVAYVVAQGTDALSSITEARRIDEGAQFVFDSNFQSPSPGPPVVPTVETGDDFIDLIWETAPQVTFTNVTERYDLRFEGYKVTAYRTNTTQDFVELIENSTLIAGYDLDNRLENVFQQTGAGGFELRFPYNEDNQLDTIVYADEDEGVIRLRIREDPFTGRNLVKGRPYYFSITGYYLNYEALRYRSAPDNPDSQNVRGDYFLSSQSLIGESQNINKITVVTLGEDLYDPPFDLQSGDQTAGFSEGQLEIDIYNKAELTGDDYKVTFFIDSASATYSTYWRLENTSTNTLLVDSVKDYLFGDDEIAIPELQTEGFIVKLSDETPLYDNLRFDQVNELNEWFDEDSTRRFIVTENSAQSTTPTWIRMGKATYLTVDKLRRVELKLGEEGKAYRYLNGFIKQNPLPASRKNTYVYAEGVSESDTTGKGTVGLLGQGWVDVPFTAWVEDERYGERRQLAVGFIETAIIDGGTPDGIWEPGTSIRRSIEYIVIFNSDYDPGGNQTFYKGGTHWGVPDADWADLRADTYDIPEGAPATAEERLMAESPYFDAMYVIAVERMEESSAYDDGDILFVPVLNYPYTTADEFTFSTVRGGDLSDQQEKDLFDRVNVFPNPLFGFNPATSYTNANPDEPFVTFSNLPAEVTIKIYSLSGQLLRTLEQPSTPSPFLRWDIKNQSDLRVASGMYLAIVSSPKYGDKVLKFAIIMPQKQLPKF